MLSRMEPAKKYQEKEIQLFGANGKLFLKREIAQRLAILFLEILLVFVAHFRAVRKTNWRRIFCEIFCRAPDNVLKSL